MVPLMPQRHPAHHRPHLHPLPWWESKCPHVVLRATVSSVVQDHTRLLPDAHFPPASSASPVATCGRLRQSYRRLLLHQEASRRCTSAPWMDEVWQPLAPLRVRGATLELHRPYY